MDLTRLSASDALPLTCTREGTCCHGKEVRINPWELACLAAARGQQPAAFRAAATDHGVMLRFDGARGWQGLRACSQYDPAARGCRAWPGRPLACRLYPLGRERRADGPPHYVHQGRSFPCLTGCPGVTALPALRVDEYLRGQGTAAGEAVQDAYLELMQDLAEGAFVIAFESGLARRDAGFLKRWQAMAALDHRRRAAALGGWHDHLTLPGLPPEDGPAFAACHRQQLQQRAQSAFASLGDARALAEASAVMLGLALQCAAGIGADGQAAAATWVARARAMLE